MLSRIVVGAGIMTSVIAGIKGFKIMKLSDYFATETPTNQALSGKTIGIIAAAIVGGVVYLIFKSQEKQISENKPKFDKIIELNDQDLQKISNISSQQFKELYQLYCCPITNNLMKQPVSIDCGHQFQKKGIIEHMKKDKRCPLCRNQVKQNIRPAFNTKSSIQKLRKRAVKKGQQFLRQRINQDFQQQFGIIFK